MSIFDGILGNLEGMAEKFGIPADQLQALAATAQEKFASGDMSGLMQMAQDHGISPDKIQEMMSGAGMADMMSKATEMFGGSAGSDNPLGGLADMAKGMFGKN